MINPEQKNYEAIERLERLLRELRDSRSPLARRRRSEEIGFEIAIAIREVGAMLVNVGWEQTFTEQTDPGATTNARSRGPARSDSQSWEDRSPRPSPSPSPSPAFASRAAASRSCLSARRSFTFCSRALGQGLLSRLDFDAQELPSSLGYERRPVSDAQDEAAAAATTSTTA